MIRCLVFGHDPDNDYSRDLSLGTSDNWVRVERCSECHSRLSVEPVDTSDVPREYRTDE